MTIEEVKTCTDCNISQNLIAGFSRDKYKADGHNSRCKTCIGKKAKVARGLAKARRGMAAPKKIIVAPKGKILCNRNGEFIPKGHCIPGCNDACIPCENKQMQNIGAGSDTLTPEDDKEAMIAGTWGSSSAIAVNEGHCEK